MVKINGTHLTLEKNKSGEIKLKNTLCTYTYETYNGELTDFYEILQYYKKKYPGKWINSRMPSPVGWGYLMTIEYWKECCDEGGFIDYDGYGCILDENYDYLTNSRPSVRHRVPKNGKYIMWFNK